METAKEKNRFKEFCSANGLTAKRVAEECGISINTVWAYFQGVRSPSKKNMKALAEKYGANVYELFIK